MPRREQGTFRREVMERQAERQVKAPVPVPRPVSEKKQDVMEEDEEGPEEEGQEEGSRETPIDVVVEVVAPQEAPKPVDVRQKSREEEVTTMTLPKKGEELTAAMGQSACGPLKDKRRVVVDEGILRVGRRERREEEKGEDDERSVTVEESTEESEAASRQTEGMEKQERPVFDDMEEPTVEIAVWTTAREEAMKKVVEGQ